MPWLQGLAGLLIRGVSGMEARAFCRAEDSFSEGSRASTARNKWRHFWASEPPGRRLARNWLASITKG